MKLIKWLIALFLTSSAAIANAEIHTQGIYLGVGFGWLDVKVIETEITEVSGGQRNFVLGYGFGKFSIEFELANGEANESLRAETNSILNGWISTETLDVRTKANLYSLYGVYRSPGKFYFKARLGASYTDIDTSTERTKLTLNSNSVSSSSVGDSSLELSFGVGAGYRFKTISIEMEYAKSGSDISYINLLSLKYHF